MPNKSLFLYVNVAMPMMILGMAFCMVMFTSWTTTGRWLSFFDRPQTESGRRTQRMLYVLLTVMAVVGVALTVYVVWVLP